MTMTSILRLPTPWVRRSAASLFASVLIPALVPSLGLAQAASDQAPAAPAAAAAPAAGTGKGEAPIMLSPFEVNAEQSQGYFTPNTLAGTRLNTNIGDIAGSVTVVTKEQMEDTNALNINDVFQFEANTEGALTYTPVNLVRSNVADSLSGIGGPGSFSDALDNGNRIRGLAAADNEEDNFTALNRIPFDTYNTQSIEIDRGPNSIIYGTGSPADIVNQTTADAVLNKFSGEAQLEGGSWGTFRETVNFNIPLIKDKLALYVAQLYNSAGFEQKPSSDIARREYAALTFSPFKTHKTTIKGSFEYYNEYGNDPNYITPVDFVTPWIASGRPIYNPLTATVSYLSTGKTTGTYVLSTTNPLYIPGEPTGTAALTSTTSPLYVPSLTFFSGGHMISFVDQGKLLYTFKGQQNGFAVSGFMPSTLTGPQTIISQELISQSTALPNPAGYATWQAPTVSSKGIYDWSSINVNSINWEQTSAKTYHLDLQQEIVPNLNLDLAWFRQELRQTADDPLSQANATTMYVDTNAYLLNGAPNPHVGQPFLDTYQSDIAVTPEINNNYRGMLEYELNFQDKVPSWLDWLGHHRFLAVYSQHDDVQTLLRYRPAIVGGSDSNYLPTTAAQTVAGWQYGNALETDYYMGGAAGQPDGVGTMAPGFMNRPGYGGPTTVPIQTYNYGANAWQQTYLHVEPVLFATGGLQENLQDSKTYFWQSWFWNDRIVGSVGIDDTMVKNRQTNLPTQNGNALLYTNGLPNTQYWYGESPWTYIGGNTSTTGVVVHPFKNWAAIDSAAARGDLLPAFLRTLSFTFNKSDNFNPPAANYTDYFGNPLGKPEGQEKDYGVEIATPDNKLFLRATWFTTNDLNQHYQPISIARANYIDQTELSSWATDVVRIRHGDDPSSPAFNTATDPVPITAALQTEIATLKGLPYNYGGNVGANGEYVNPSGTENGVSKGIDLEMEYNPLPNWTMKLTWGKQLTTVSGIADQAAAWIAARYPVWQKYTAPDMAASYTLSNGTPLQLQSFWQATGITNISPTNAFGWTTTQNYYNIVVADQLANDQAPNGEQASNQREYSWTYLTNYQFDHGPLNGVGIGTALNFDGRAVAGYYGSTTNLTSTGLIQVPNPGAPIYTASRLHINLWASYQFKLPWSNLHAKVQLNIDDLTSNGYLLPVTYNLDGSPSAERIIPPRQYYVTTTVKF